ncbi:MAG: Hpt domain-containing protein [Leptospiraceae bacterium]|nr:Hpt domain-containing protein [Leptospiraceae bacterium]MDW7976249.1 Hpt domain-containing protein [Leptospiraceae bacterium]
MKYKVEISKEIQDIVPVFLEEFDKNVKLLEQAIDSQDYETIRSITHKIKGSAGGYGFHQISEYSKVIENLAKNRSPIEQIQNQFKKMIDYYHNMEIIYTNKPLT